MAASKSGKRVDRRVLRTREAIMTAFDKLMSNSSIDRITVSAIAREANIDRKTFYLHYSSIDDLANRKAEEGIERILEALKTHGEGKTPRERVHIVLSEANSIFSANLTVYSNIASRLSTDQMLERLEQAAEPALSHAGMTSAVNVSEQAHMRLQFYFAGAFSLYSTWLKSNHREPIETVSNAIENAIVSSMTLPVSNQQPAFRQNG